MVCMSRSDYGISRVKDRRGWYCTDGGQGGVPGEEEGAHGIPRSPIQASFARCDRIDASAAFMQVLCPLTNHKRAMDPGLLA